jgi:cell division septum initiation protein DivIVA
MSTEYNTNPGSKSPEEVQREVRQSRTEVEENLEAIQERLAPGQLFEQAVDYMRSSNGSDFLRNLGAVVRDNPVPVALVGTGLAWLMLSSSRSGREEYDEEDDLPTAYGESRRGGGSYRESHRGRGLSEDAAQAGRWGESARETTREWSQGARTAARSARDRARRLSASALDRVSETGEQLWHGARDVGDRASYYGRQVRRGFFDTLHEQPLVLGALGLAAGAAIGAALPTTGREDEWLGEARDRLKDGARRLTREQLERARAAGRAAYEAAIEEADRQGWSAEGAMSAADAAVQKAERVAAAATEAARAEAERPGGQETGSSAPSQLSDAAGRSTSTPMTEAERHGLGQTSSRFPSGT